MQLEINPYTQKMPFPSNDWHAIDSLVHSLTIDYSSKVILLDNGEFFFFLCLSSYISVLVLFSTDGKLMISKPSASAQC